VPALYSRLGGRPLFSDTGDRPLTVAEIQHGLGRARDLLAERAPVWLQGHVPQPRPAFDEQADRLRRTLHAEYGELSPEGRRDREGALDGVSNLCDEAVERTFPELALGKEPPAYDGRCPFRGLYPFRASDREFFFGREALVERLEGRLAEANFLAVLGPSGSGKSSVVLAGLIPALESKEQGLSMAYLTPGSDPLEFLEAVLQVADRPSLLVVDQFEELFTLCADDGKRRAFLDRLLGLRNQMRVVLTMRADFWGECAPYRELKELMQAHQDLIAPMEAAELRQAMEKQAGQVGLRFEADLSNTILDDVQGEPGAMPLLAPEAANLRRPGRRRPHRPRLGLLLRLGTGRRATGGVRERLDPPPQRPPGRLGHRVFQRALRRTVFRPQQRTAGHLLRRRAGPPETVRPVDRQQRRPQPRRPRRPGRASQRRAQRRKPPRVTRLHPEDFPGPPRIRTRVRSTWYLIAFDAAGRDLWA
jgi:hypothetical protein